MTSGTYPSDPPHRPPWTERIPFGRWLRWLLGAAAWQSLALAAGQIVLPPYFADNMAMQETSEPVVVWGWSDLENGYVEIQGRKAPWRRTNLGPRREGWKAWEARIERLTNSASETLRIVGGKDSAFRPFEPVVSVQFTNVVVANVWLLFANPDPHAPHASLPPGRTNRLWSGCRVLRVDAPDAVTGWPAAVPPLWTRARPEDLPASVCFFASNAMEARRSPGIGILWMPAASDYGRRLAQWLYSSPRSSDPRGELVQQLIANTQNDVDRTFEQSDARRRIEFDEAKLLGRVLPAAGQPGPDIPYFRDFRLVTPTDFHPLRLGGVLR